MGQITDWFCANCLRTIGQLSRHGRCPHCDSNAVDVAYRLNISKLPTKASDAALSFELPVAHVTAIGAAKAARIQ
jgi:hypothetical protein